MRAVFLFLVLSTFFSVKALAAPKEPSHGEIQFIETVGRNLRELPTRLEPGYRIDCGLAHEIEVLKQTTYPDARLPGWDLAAGKASVLTQEQADQVFDRLASLRHIAFGMTEEGCVARAHEMARILDGYGIKTVKVFVSASSPRQYLTAGTLPGQVSREVWGFHVAPALLVQKEGRLELQILDPSMYVFPVNLDEWISRMTMHQPGMKTSVSIRNRKTLLDSAWHELAGLSEEWDRGDRTRALDWTTLFKWLQDRRKPGESYRELLKRMDPFEPSSSSSPQLEKAEDEVDGS